MKIEKEINKLDLLFLNIPKSLSDLFEEEGYIETKDHGRFIIKEKNLANDGYEIVGRYDLEEFNDWIDAKAYVTETPKEMLEDLLQGKDWTVVSSITTKRTVTATNVSMIALIKQIVDTFNAEVMFNNVTKTIYVEEELGSDKGVYFHNELNLRRLNISSDTYDFATRMIPRGINGEGIEQINNGVPYVENHTYSDKIVTVIWEDERYTHMDKLKADAEKKLEVLSKPRRAFTADIVNLAKSSKEYSILDYSIGDTITLIDSNLKEMVKHDALLDTWGDLEDYTWGELSNREWGDLSYSFDRIKEKQRIVKLVHYPDNPLKDTIDIENRPRKLGDREEERIENLEGSNSVIKASLELLEDSVVSTVEKIENLRIEAENRLYQSQTQIPFELNQGRGTLQLFREAYHPYYKVVSDTNIDLSAAFPQSQYAEDLTGEEVTISLDVLVDVDRVVNIDGKDFEVKGNRWTRIHVTKMFPINDTVNKRVRTPYSRQITRDKIIGNKLIDSLSTDINTIYYRNLQVQRGDVPTNWTLTPEELEADVNRLISEFKQVEDSISLLVKRNEDSGRFEVNTEGIIAEINKTDGVGKVKTVGVTINEYGLTVDGGAVIVRDSENTAIVTSQGLKIVFVYTSSGELNGFQKIGVWNEFGDVVRREAFFFVNIPDKLTITKAELSVISMPTYKSGYSFADGFYHARNLSLYRESDMKGFIYFPYAGSCVVLYDSGGTNITNDVWGGVWSPSGDGVQEKIGDVTNILTSGKNSFIVKTSDSVGSQANERYNGGLQFTLVVEGYLRG